MQVVLVKEVVFFPQELGVEVLLLQVLMLLLQILEDQEAQVVQIQFQEVQ
jgi:hypothetical protein